VQGGAGTLVANAQQAKEGRKMLDHPPATLEPPKASAALPKTAAPAAHHSPGLHGNDVSSGQPDWQPGPGDGFVFIKSTEGQSYQNPAAGAQAKRARKAGLVVGWYHYLWPRYDRGKPDGSVTSGKVVSGTPEVQAHFFLDHTAVQPGELLAVDWEHAGSFTHGHEGGYASYQEKDRFISEVRRLRPDLKIGLYVNRSMWNASNKHAGDFLWLAEYAPAPTIAEPWLFWQYSDRAPNGASLDQNRSRFNTIHQLRDWIAQSDSGDDMTLTEAQLDQIADTVLARDGRIKNTFTGNPNNEYVTLATAVAAMGAQLDEISASLARIVPPAGPH
jgi:GH25 family lysozyme M1 (1,4-beta-N-acetylmuramidase)